MQDRKLYARILGITDPRQVERVELKLENGKVHIIDWVGDCPLSYSSPNAPTNREFLGTWMLSVLADHKRYAHVTALRGDGVSPQVLGMRRIVSKDALRRAIGGLTKKLVRSGCAGI